MAEYERREIAVNLVRKHDDDTYRIVDNMEMIHLRATRNIVFEKSRIDKKYIGSFYIEMEK